MVFCCTSSTSFMILRSGLVFCALLLVICRSRTDHLGVLAFRPTYLITSSRPLLIQMGATRKLSARVHSSTRCINALVTRSTGSHSGDDVPCRRIVTSRFRGLFSTPSSRKASIIATSVMLSIASNMIWPSSSSAFDMASLTGDASTLLAQTVTWWSAVAETGFYQAFSLVFLSEIGDKTFFIAGLSAMKTTRFISFLGSMGALVAMTIVSVLIGQMFHAVPSGFLADGIPLDDIAAALAFAFFGFKNLKEALATDTSSGSAMDDELAEAEEAIEKRRGIEEGVTPWGQIASIFALVFAAEFGDRSFLSTIALSAAQNPISVAGGAVAAHALATGVAVSGGSFVAKYISEKVIGIISGSLFLVFAVTTVLGIF